MVPSGGSSVTVWADPCVTPLGRRLHLTKLGELPLLLNVPRGDMSFVGPSPEDPNYVALYTDEQRRVLSISRESPASRHWNTPTRNPSCAVMTGTDLPRTDHAGEAQLERTTSPAEPPGRTRSCFPNGDQGRALTCDVRAIRAAKIAQQLPNGRGAVRASALPGGGAKMESVIVSVKSGGVGAAMIQQLKLIAAGRLSGEVSGRGVGPPLQMSAMDRGA